ncbi:unnamed protein product [Effrenium voratum]|nr:unnamed protein product [Effrenium voratum]
MMLRFALSYRCKLRGGSLWCFSKPEFHFQDRLIQHSHPTKCVHDAPVPSSSQKYTDSDPAQVLSIHWESSPVNDLVADSVSLTAIELTRSPSMLTALRGTDTGKEEERIFKVLRTYLEQEFGRLSVDVKKMVLSFEVDGNTVTVNFPSRLVECQEEALSQRVRTALRRCERSLRPIPAF